jgi:hypothetical protein
MLDAIWYARDLANGLLPTAEVLLCAVGIICGIKWLLKRNNVG